MAPSLGSSKTGGTGSLLLVYRLVVVHWRAILVLLILGRAVSIVIHSESVFFELTVFAILLIFIASQLFWIGRVIDLGEWLLAGKLRARLPVISTTYSS